MHLTVVRRQLNRGESSGHAWDKQPGPVNSKARIMRGNGTLEYESLARTTWFLAGLNPTPEEEWQRLRRFIGIQHFELEAMLATVEALFRRGYELVVSTYDYLQEHDETAAILGWEAGADPEHLAERRRFFTVWLARTLGLDFSDDFAHYLFAAGRKHAGHGKRQVHVPAAYVTGSISLVLSSFARILQEERPGNRQLPAALSGWNKVLALHLHMMLLGYEAARSWDQGDFDVSILSFGRVRNLIGRSEMRLRLGHGQQMSHLLRKVFNYFPEIRPEVFDVVWDSHDRLDEKGRTWLDLVPKYCSRRGWRVLLNGRNFVYAGGLEKEVQPNDEISIFPPGR
jgi:molybdopterin converting factor small subunit